jgi:prepilin-type processing-associated H-X9-DG protein
MTSSRQGRTGFSLVEFFVVLIIIGVALGFLVPALVASRETGRRVHCLNNMRQIALATQNYHEHYCALPPGSVNPTGPIHNLRDGVHMGWLVHILPYVEQGGVAMQIDPNASAYDPRNAGAALVSINILRCPSGIDPAVVTGVGMSSYAGCHHDVEAPIDVDNLGVLYLNSCVRLGDIDDGTSTTLMIGEKLNDPSDLGWLSGTRATLRNTSHPINTGTEPGSDDRVGGFSSRHPGGANFIYCDGSVRFLREQIRPEVYRRLGNRADGELVDEIGR